MHWKLRLRHARQAFSAEGYVVNTVVGVAVGLVLASLSAVVTAHVGLALLAAGGIVLVVGWYFLFWLPLPTLTAAIHQGGVERRGVVWLGETEARLWEV